MDINLTEALEWWGNQEPSFQEDLIDEWYERTMSDVPEEYNEVSEDGVSVWAYKKYSLNNLDN